MNILGINAYHGDVSAVLVRDGELIAAVEEERFRRIKHWAGFPGEAIDACLAIGGLKSTDVERFAISRNPKAHLWRKVAFSLSRRPKLSLILDRAKNQGRVGHITRELANHLHVSDDFVQERMHWVEHHPSHLASAFFVSPFEEAAVGAVDGFGDFVSTSLAHGRGNQMDVLGRTFFPHSLGLLYLAITQYLGFPKYGDEFKVMGLAPYGAPEFANEIRELVDLTDNGGFALDLSYFRHWSGGATMTWDAGEPTLDAVYTPKLEELLGPARKPDEPIEPKHEAIASSLQHVFEEAYFHVLNALHERTGSKNLCLAGGCAMNSVANGRIRETTDFENVFIQPAAGDNGTALGAAYYVWNQVQNGERRFVMDHASWGPTFSESHIESTLAHSQDELDENRCRFERLHDEELYRAVAEQIASGDIVGWFQGRMEWGARALGNRSILADPRRADMRDVINRKIKFREKFRPFAPAVLEEAFHDYFDGAMVDPFMVQVHPVRPERRAEIPAVTHVDGSGRLQTVSRSSNERFWKLIRAFADVTGVPVLLNTSFNENEPIVHRPEEAVDCFLRTRMDALVLGNYLIRKSPTSFDEMPGPEAELVAETETETETDPCTSAS